MFDPYEKWLGISRDQRPVDYFLLLGLDPKEKDATVIRTAAEQQAARLNSHKEGPHAQACARLLKEITQAQTTLLTPAKRKAYEAQVRQSAAPKAEGAEEAEENAPPRRAASKDNKKGTAKSAKKPARRQEKSRLWLWLALGGAAALLLVGGALAFWLTRPKKDAAPVQPGPVAAVSQPQSPVLPPKPIVPEKTPAPAPPPKEVPKPVPPAPPVAAIPPPPAPLSRPAVRKPKPHVVKLPVPDKAAQDKAEKAIKNVYQADYAKNKPEDHLALAAKFLQPGRENRADPAAWFVLLREARDAAVRAEQPRLAVEAIDEIDKWFVIDAFAMKLQTLNALVQAGGEDAARAASKTALSQVEEALIADNFDAALRLADAAEAAARKGKFDKQLPAIESSRREVKEFQQTYPQVAAAREKLRKTPDDPSANRVVGRHICFFQGSWDEGLPLLAKGGDDEGAALARQDLTPPTNVKAQTDVGDGWWLMGKRQTERETRHLHERALAWYELVQSEAVGEEKARLTERMEEVIRARAARVPRLKPGSFFGRGEADRILLLREGGGSMYTEEAVQLGLDWLALHQSSSGMWSNHAFQKSAKKCNCGDPGQQFDVAGTCFGLLPFLGAGETPRHGRHKRTVARALTYLLLQQKPEGKFSDNMYENALATIAVCETYGLTKDQRYRVPAQLAVQFIVQAQHEGGSWGYSPNAKGDTSITAWQFSALKAAHYAGLEVPSATFLRVGSFLDTVADPAGLGYGYNTPGTARSTTSASLLCREYLGWWPSHPGLSKAMAPLLLPQNFVTKDKPSIYFIYYATQVMHHAGGEAWESWNPKVRDLLLEMQDQGKEAGREHQKGSWSPRGDDYAVQGGRLMFTSLALLTLEVYYYHVPINGYGPAVLQN